MNGDKSDSGIQLFKLKEQFYIYINIYIYIIFRHSPVRTANTKVTFSTTNLVIIPETFT